VYYTKTMKTTHSNAAAIFTGMAAAAILTGCEFKAKVQSGSYTSQPPTAVEMPPQVSAVRKATAVDLINAANSNIVPEWFTEADRKAVKRIQN
jgi:hypothetical protein